MGLPFAEVQDALVSHALTLGVFDKVELSEPTTAPGYGLLGALWPASIRPAESGLASTSVLLVFTFRIYKDFKTAPAESIDRNIVEAVDLLLEAYSGDFTLGGLARNIDLMGRYGPALSAQATYLTQDNKIYRVMDITVPVVLNDVWEQVA